MLRFLPGRGPDQLGREDSTYMNCDQRSGVKDGEVNYSRVFSMVMDS